MGNDREILGWWVGAVMLVGTDHPESLAGELCQGRGKYALGTQDDCERSKGQKGLEWVVQMRCLAAEKLPPLSANKKNPRGLTGGSIRWRLREPINLTLKML